MANIDTVLTISGVNDYLRSIKEVQGQIGNLKTAMRATSEEYKHNENAVEGLQAKQNILQQQIAEQAKIVEQAARVQAQFRNEYGETNATTVRMTNELNKAKTALFALQNQLEQVNVRLDDVRNNESAFTQAIEASKTAVKDGEVNLKLYASELSAIQAQYANTGNAVEADIKRQEVLRSAYTQSAKIVSELEKQLADMAATMGTDSNEYKELQINVNNARTRMNEYGTALEQNTRALQTHSGALQQANDKMRAFADNYRTGAQSVEQITGAMSSVGNALSIGVTLPLTAAAAASLAAGQEINKNLANIGTLGIGAERLAEIKKGIQEIGIAAGKNTTDIAEGTYSIISALGDTNDTLDITAINAKSAAAGLATTQEAINLTTAVTKGYGDTSAEAFQKASDLAFQTLVLGQTTYPELAKSIGAVVPTSNALKISQEELFNVFATLTGVTGNASEVATQYGSVLTALMKPNKELTALLNEQGYASGFAAVEALGFKGTLDMMVKAANGSEDALVQLVGRKEAVTAMFALTGAQASEYARKLAELQDAAGATDAAFAAQSEGVNAAGFSFEQSMVRMQVAAQGFAESAAPFIDKAASSVEGITEWLASLNDEQRQTIIVIGALVAAVGPALSISSQLITVVAGLQGVMAAHAASATAAAAATSAQTTATVANTSANIANTVSIKTMTAAMLASPLFAAVAVTTGLTLLYKAVTHLTGGFEDYAKTLIDATKAYDDAIGKANQLTSELDTVGKRIDELNAKDPLALTDEDEKELNRLERINRQLAFQLELQQAISEQKRAEMNDAAAAVLTENPDVFIRHYGGGGHTEKGDSQLEALDKSITKYEDLKEALEEAKDAQANLNIETDRAEIDKKAAEIAGMENQLAALKSEILTLSTTVNDNASALDGNTESGAALLVTIGALNDRVSESVTGYNLAGTAANEYATAQNNVAAIVDMASESLKQLSQSFVELSDKYKSGVLSSKDYTESLKNQLTEVERLSAENPELAKSYNQIAEIIKRELSRSPEYIKELSNASSELIGVTDRLTSAFDEQSKTGELSNKTAMDLITTGYAACVQIDAETGKITINEQAYRELVAAKIEDQIATLESAKQTAMLDKLSLEQSAAKLAAYGFLELAQARLMDAKAAGESARDLDMQIKLLENMKNGLSKVTVEHVQQRSESSKSSNAQRDAFRQAVSDLEERAERERLTADEIIAGYEKIRDTAARTEDEKLEITRKITDLQRQEVERYGDAATEAIRRGYEDQRDAAMDYLDDMRDVEREHRDIVYDGSQQRVDIVADEYIQRVALIDEETAAFLQGTNKKIQAQIDLIATIDADLAAELQAKQDRINAIDEEIGANRRRAEEQRHQDQLASLQERINNAKDEDARMSAQKAYDNYVQDYNRRKREQQLNDEKKALQDNMKDIAKIADEKKKLADEEIAFQQEAQNEMLEMFIKRLDDEKVSLKAFYDDLIAAAPEMAAQLFAAGDTGTLNALIAQYNPSWQTANYGFADYLNKIQNANKDSLTDSVTFETEQMAKNYEKVNKMLAGQSEIVHETVDDMADGVREILLDLAEDSYLMGKMSGEGILSGFSDMEPIILDKVRSVANAICATFEEEQGIASPSKVMRQSARWSGLGVASGLDDSLLDIRRAARNLAQTVRAESAILSGAAGSGFGGNQQVTTYNSYNDQAGDTHLNFQFHDSRFGGESDARAMSEHLMFLIRRQQAGRGRRRI